MMPYDQRTGVKEKGGVLRNAARSREEEESGGA